MTEPKKFRLQDRFIDEKLEHRIIASIVANRDVYYEIVDHLPVNDLISRQPKFGEMISSIEQKKEIPQIPSEWIPLPSLELESAAKQLGNLFQRRILANGLEKNLADLKNKDINPEDILNSYEETIAHARKEIKDCHHGQAISVLDCFPNILKDIKQRYLERNEKGIGHLGLSTGFKEFDELLGGLQEGIHILAAEPGCGKTTLARQIGAKVAFDGTPCLFVSFEEAVDKLALKLICSSSGLISKKFLDGFGDPKELEQAYIKNKQKFEKFSFLEGGSKTSIDLIKAKAYQLMARFSSKKCLIIIDYLQQWAGKRRDYNDFRHTVGSLLGDLRELSLKIKSPILVICSQNRSGQGSGSMTSLKESGELEYGGDSISFLVNSNRTVKSPMRAIDLKVAKNRNGDRKDIHLLFQPETGVFSEGEFEW